MFESKCIEYPLVRHRFGILVLAGLASVTPGQRAAASTVGFGIMSASNSDEYRANDNRCGSTQWASTTLSWDEQLVRARGLDFGRWGTWDGNPRRTGYEFNWARSGVNVSTMISMGQHTGLAAQVAAGKVQYAILSIGANDVDSNTDVFNGTYRGTWTQTQIDAKRNQMIEGIALAADTVLQAGVAGMVIGDVENWLSASETQLAYPNPVGRQRFGAFIAALNADIAAIANSRSIALGSVSSFEAYVLTRVDANGDLVIDGEVISLHTRSCDPRSSRINDQTGHFGTVLQALDSNVRYIGPLNARYGLGIAPFTDQEILANAGIRTGPPPPDSAAPSVSLNAPAPNSTVSGTSTLVSAIASDNVGVRAVQFRLDGLNLGAEDTSAPYSIRWDTTAATEGSHGLLAVARDGAGNVGTSAPLTVTVVNAAPPDPTAPMVSLTAPAAGSIVSGASITVSANASDNVGVSGVQFKRDGVHIGAEDTSAPYAVTWNTTTTTNGSHVLKAEARDRAGNLTTSGEVVVMVANAPSPVAVNLSPYQYVVEKGTLRSGNVASVGADDNAYLVVRSNGSGAVRTTRVDLDFRDLPAAGTVTAASLNVALKESAPPATLRISMWNYVTSAWAQIDTVSLSATSELLRTVPLSPSALGSYRSASGLARVRVSVDRWQSTTHDVSHDLVRLTLTQ